MTKLHPQTKRRGWQECELCRRDFNAREGWHCPYCGFDNNPSVGVVVSYAARIASKKSAEKRRREATNGK